MYAELHCKTNYSFLTGGSHPDELVHQANTLGYSALAITDENSLAGIVRAHAAARDQSVRLIIGAEIIPNDAPSVVLWAPNRNAYAQLSRLITVGRRRAPKGECWLKFDDIAAHSSELLAGVVPQIAGDHSPCEHISPTHLSYEWFSAYRPESGHEQRYRELFGERAYLLAELYQGVDDQWRISQLQKRSQKTGLPTSSLALGWLCKQPAISSVVVGIKTQQQLHENISAIRVVNRDKLITIITRIANIHGGYRHSF